MERQVKVDWKKWNRARFWERIRCFFGFHNGFVFCKSCPHVNRELINKNQRDLLNKNNIRKFLNERKDNNHEC